MPRKPIHQWEYKQEYLYYMRKYDYANPRISSEKRKGEKRKWVEKYLV